MRHGCVRVCVYMQVTNSIFKRDVVSFSEIYEGTNFKMDMTTASVSVYDKSDPDRWKMLGTPRFHSPVVTLVVPLGYFCGNSVNTS